MGGSTELPPIRSVNSPQKQENLHQNLDLELFNQFEFLKRTVQPYRGRKVDNSLEWQRYVLVNRFKDREYVTYEKLNISWNSMDRYSLIRHIGRGKYGEVFLGQIDPLAKTESMSQNPNLAHSSMSEGTSKRSCEKFTKTSPNINESRNNDNNDEILHKNLLNNTNTINNNNGISKMSKYPSVHERVLDSENIDLNPNHSLCLNSTNDESSDCLLRVIKVLKPVRYIRLQREIKILLNLSNHCNIVKLVDVIKDPTYNYHAYVFEYVKSETHHHIFSKFNIFNIQNYIYQILLGLDFMHSRGIMHRDIKPQNIIYNMKTRDLKIIDFGLAEYYIEDKDNAIRVASKYYKGPELFLEYSKYDYSLDIWAVGCILASIIFMKEPFFTGSDNRDMITKMVSVFGYEEFIAYLTKYKIHQDAEFLETVKDCRPQRWRNFFNTKYIDRVSEQSLDFLDSLLIFDHKHRISPRQALRHSYFESVLCIYGENVSS